MKVLHVIPSVGPLRGGPSMMIRGLAGALSRQGVETHVATTNDNGRGTLHVPFGVPVLEDAVTYWYFPRQTHLYTFSWPLGVWLARHVADFDAVHIHALFSYAAVPAAYWARRRGVPYIVRPLGTLNEWGMKNRRRWIKKWSFRLLESRIIEHAALVHYTSNQERLEAEKLHQGRTAAAIIPNAIAETPGSSPAGCFRARFPQLENRQILLFLSRLDEVKGLYLLLRAFGQIRQQIPHVSLVVAGDGNPAFVSGLKAKAVRLGIERDVVWPGFLNGELKQAALADSDVFVLPSYSENFGIAVAEAMAAGLAVVVSNQVGIHRDIQQAQAGIVVPCDVASLAGALVQLLDDAGLRRWMGDNGRSLVRRHYSSQAVTHKLIDVYNELAH
jgi:glycosyltransferase involved in cell wall biosynthesis